MNDLINDASQSRYVYMIHVHTQCCVVSKCMYVADASMHVMAVMNKSKFVFKLCHHLAMM